MTFTKNISGSFFFDPADEIYLEHFPGNPVVPGSIIINAFVDALMKNKIQSPDYKIKNFRFKKFVSPGEYKFDITAVASNYSCRLYSDEKTAVTGVIMI